MRTSAYQVSSRHFVKAERIVHSLMTLGGARSTVGQLSSAVGAQSRLGQSLVDLITRDPSQVEAASTLFLDVLRLDGHVGPYYQ